MTFGKKIRELRLSKRLTLRELAEKVGVGFTYISKIENQKLEEGHSPSEKLIHMLAGELDADEGELLLLAEKVPDFIRRRVCERPDVFQIVAQMNDEEMDRLLHQFVRKHS